MDLKSISLMQKLMNFTISNNLDHTTGILANYLLLHYNELGTLPLNQVTADCFVSPSSVRRFCLKLGFDNYSDLVEARLRNPEHQPKIGVTNLLQGAYHPAMLRAEINENLFLCFRSVSAKQLQFLAASVLRSFLISASVSERIFLSIASMGMSNPSSDIVRLLFLLPTALPHPGQNLTPSRKISPQSGHFFSFITLAPHFGQN